MATALGRTVAGSRALFASYEDVVVDIAGPRTGKTTGGSVMMVLQAPGACVATTNKRDLVDATRDPRATVGAVWVFDPQAIVDEPVAWCWNPLSYVTDEVKAKMLADIFTSASRVDPNARTDAFFEPVATELLANLLLAAALATRPITQVYLWLTDPSDDEAVEILDGAGYDLVAAGLREVIHAPEKQRGGVYGTAKQIAAFLTNRQAARWATPGGSRRAFDPHAFVRSADTLYSISREGIASAAPLVTALTVAVMEAGEALAQRSPGGRLGTPMTVVLDEAANVCRWAQLPNQYSHYGSKAINVITYLQSWSQGVESGANTACASCGRQRTSRSTAAASPNAPSSETSAPRSASTNYTRLRSRTAAAPRRTPLRSDPSRSSMSPTSPRCPRAAPSSWHPAPARRSCAEPRG